MGRRRGLPLATLFSAASILITIVSFAVTVLLTGLAFWAGLLTQPNPVQQLISLAFVGLISGVILALIAGRLVLMPVNDFIENSSRIVQGDFTVRCDEEGAIAEVRQIAAGFNALVQELGQVETLRSDFIANVSHELKTPLAVIEGYAALLESGDLPEEERRRCTGEILSGARRLSRLVSSILRLSSLENQTLALERRRYRLDEQLRRCLLQLEPEWSQKGLYLEVDLPEVWCTGNEELLEQVWLNLYGNAVKFTPPGGCIGTRVRQRPDALEVEISDSGIGMSKEVQRRIFEKFYQADTSHSGAGSGLGLALVRRILTLHGAEIRVESAPGSGSCFTVQLPL